MSKHYRPIKRRIEHRGRIIPTFLYGTAWKENQTETLIKIAVSEGFLGIDTANQRRHYNEKGVGRAVKNVLDENQIKRSDLFLQSKFTYAASQDHRLPYDQNADFSTQVRQSFESSLEHLNTTYLDSYVLHGPASMYGLSPSDWEVWREMEELKRAGSVKLLGVSNIGYDQLSELLEQAEIKPAFVQNRCFATTKWDVRIRELCRPHDIIYQGFSLLTANSMELNRPEIYMIAKRLKCTVAQLVFRFAMQVGMIPLTGTTSRKHMKEDLSVYDIELLEEEVRIIENISL